MSTRTCCASSSCWWHSQSALRAPPKPRADAAAIIRAAIDYWRDVSSYSVADMTIHRPDWQRTMTIRVWTRGEKQSLVRVMAPAKDAGNATLLHRQRDVELHAQDQPRDQDPVEHDEPELDGLGLLQQRPRQGRRPDRAVSRTSCSGSEARDGHTVYVIESVPKETAPVVWGARGGHGARRLACCSNMPSTTSRACW
ncbi:MAG: hypothetical protein MZW92_46555 [Comamonadaceae bacterium]|nr:hypothetical protein [Comamonadaceae bacterium]